MVGLPQMQLMDGCKVSVRVGHSVSGLLKGGFILSIHLTRIKRWSATCKFSNARLSDYRCTCSDGHSDFECDELPTD